MVYLHQAFDGNTDGNHKKENVFATPIIGRYLRIYPLRWGQRIAMRVEVFGCEYGKKTTNLRFVCRVTHIFNIHTEQQRAYFNGKGMIALDYSLVPIASFQDNIRFRFKTEQPDGTLLYSTGSQGDYIALMLNQNRMVLNLDLGTGYFPGDIWFRINRRFFQALSLKLQ